MDRALILTLPPNGNYGGIMQAYALQKYINITFSIDAITTSKFSAEFSGKQKELVLNSFTSDFGYDDCEFQELLPTEGDQQNLRGYDAYLQKRVTADTLRFVEKWIKTIDFFDSRPVPTAESIGGFDAFIVGSDQVWRKPYNSNLFNMFGGFLNDELLKNKKLISYGASFGIDDLITEYDFHEIELYGKLVRRFNAVSVREESGVEICKRYFDRTATHVLDPTMLLNADDYLKVFYGKSNFKPNQLIYVLDDNFSSVFPDFEVINGSDILEPVEDWLSGLYHSERVITDSFHGMVFSILFKKQFVAIVNSSRGASRFISLASSLGLQNQLVHVDSLDPKQIKEIVLRKLGNKINWNEVEDKLEVLRADSKKWLEKALGEK